MEESRSEYEEEVNFFNPLRGVIPSGEITMECEFFALVLIPPHLKDVSNML